MIISYTFIQHAILRRLDMLANQADALIILFSCITYLLKSFQNNKVNKFKQNYKVYCNGMILNLILEFPCAMFQQHSVNGQL